MMFDVNILNTKVDQPTVTVLKRAQFSMLLLVPTSIGLWETTRAKTTCPKGHCDWALATLACGAGA